MTKKQNALDCSRITHPPSGKSLRCRQKTNRTNETKAATPLIVIRINFWPNNRSSQCPWWLRHKQQMNYKDILKSRNSYVDIIDEMSYHSSQKTIQQPTRSPWWLQQQDLYLNELGHYKWNELSLQPEKQPTRSPWWLQQRDLYLNFWTFSKQEQLCPWPNSTAYSKSMVAATTRSLSERTWTL